MKLQNGEQIIEIANAPFPEPRKAVDINKAVDCWRREKTPELWVTCAWDGVARRADQITALAIV